MNNFIVGNLGYKYIKYDTMGIKVLKELVESIILVLITMFVGSRITKWLKDYGYEYESNNCFGDYDESDV